MFPMRNARSIAVLALVALAALAGAHAAAAAPNGPAERSLARCQDTVRAEGVKYVAGMQKAIGTCLGKISGEVVKKNAGVGGAVAACTRQFDKIARTDGRSIGDLFAARVLAKCSPAPDNAHALEDLTGLGFPGVGEPLQVRNVYKLCRRFGVAFPQSASEWVDCLEGAQQCAVNDAIAAQFPRAIAWLDDLAAAMPPSPARDAVLATGAALDGTWHDGVPDGGCSVEVSAPGCPDALLGREPDEVLSDLRDAVAAERWDEVACNYHPDAFVIDDQGILVGLQDILASIMSLNTLANGVDPVVQQETVYDDMARVLFTLDVGWFRIPDGISTYVIRRGRIVQQTTHGQIEFLGPPPAQS
jgi:hypothetical protein